MSDGLRELRNEMDALAAKIGRRVQLMEVCGTHTVAFFRTGVRFMLPENIRLISGPGCPVCVTAQRHIDAAIELARREGVILATYGDMLRVPGRQGSLEKLRAQGADIRIVQSVQNVIAMALHEPNRQVVFLGVGFETTAPATAATVLEAERAGIANLSVLSCYKLVVPAVMALLRDGENELDGFLCPGHVSTIIGARAFCPIVEKYQKPCVIVGFEPEQLLNGLIYLLHQIDCNAPFVENVYPTAVSDSGNTVALRLMEQVFVTADAPWRELGIIPQSGLEFAPAYQHFDALRRFGITLGDDIHHPGCMCGSVIQGKLNPDQCSLFGRPCTPVNPIGPCMVTSEGTCSAWFKYQRNSSAKHGRAVAGGGQ